MIVGLVFIIAAALALRWLIKQGKVDGVSNETSEVNETEEN